MIWPVAARRLSLRAIGRKIGLLLQPLYRSRLRSTRRAARWNSLATLIRVAFSAGHNRDAPLRRFECFQRVCACSLSTSARASSVMFNNSGHGR